MNMTTQDNLNALSIIWNEWSEHNNMPKHENGRYYSADDIAINHYQDLDFEPSIEQTKFMIAFRDVWDAMESIALSHIVTTKINVADLTRNQH
jgi:hypothetical protein|tara:strand:- start:3002 stop:3280 length:279 start_codon:yes stop_codon:yes gene_type:complete